MKFALALMVAALSVATVAGLAVLPGCPEYALDDASLPSLQHFTAQVFHYNKDNAMSGSPVGPYFSINEAAGCTWRPNGAFNCNLIIYSSADKSRAIGSGLLSSANLIWNNDAFNTSGGAVTLTTNINAALPSDLPFPSGDVRNRNFVSQTRTVYFQPKVVYPDAPATPIANRVANIAGELYLTLWGSDGYVAASDSYDAAQRGTGMDFMGHLVCPNPNTPPPIIPGCPCEDPAQIFSVPRSQIQNNVEISRRSAGTCIQLGFPSSS